jgi:SAM-dependent methyltransferase
MADVYDARPAYPVELIDALADLVTSGRRVGDVGAGIGHVALPLAERGFEVVAIEPAQAMLDYLQTKARQRGVKIRALHAAAEALPLEDASLDLAVVADALLAPKSALAVVTCELGKTPFMQSLVEIIEAAVPRRPRKLDQNFVQVAAITGIRFGRPRHFHDETPVDGLTLERILRSISFIGPAMNPARFAAFRTRVHALPGRPAWARTFTLRTGRRNR